MLKQKVVRTIKKGKKVEDLTGQKFNKLTVVRRLKDKIYKCGTVETRWLCCCDCGRETEVSGKNLKSGKVKSCGCLRGRKYNSSVVIDTADFNRIQNIRKLMISRCYNSKNKSFDIYGGRGIEVCREWRESLLAFYIWAKNHGYQANLTIDRIDVNGNYEPDNCRWITMFEQQSNKRNNVYIECLGERHTVAQWARITGLNEETIRNRYKKGLSGKKVLNIECKP